MKRTTYLIMLFTIIGGCIACSSEVPAVQSSKTLTDDFVQNHKTKASELITPQSKLLTTVEKAA